MLYRGVTLAEGNRFVEAGLEMTLTRRVMAWKDPEPKKGEGEEEGTENTQGK